MRPKRFKIFETQVPLETDAWQGLNIAQQDVVEVAEEFISSPLGKDVLAFPTTITDKVKTAFIIGMQVGRSEF